jgi:hypothetical protein
MLCLLEVEHNKFVVDVGISEHEADGIGGGRAWVTIDFEQGCHD